MQKRVRKRRDLGVRLTEQGCAFCCLNRGVPEGEAPANDSDDMRKGLRLRRATVSDDTRKGLGKRRRTRIEEKETRKPDMEGPSDHCAEGHRLSLSLNTDGPQALSLPKQMGHRLSLSLNRRATGSLSLNRRAELLGRPSDHCAEGPDGPQAPTHPGV